MHAGTFGPTALDATFGPEGRFARAAPTSNRPPSDNLQCSGTLDIDPRPGALTAAWHDVTGATLWRTTHAPPLR
jgi:alkaline phosphatase D